MQMILKYSNNYASATKSKKLIYQSRNELGVMFERFEAQQKGVRPYGDIHHVKAQDKILLEFFNQFKGKKLNCVSEPELSIELKTELFALEKKNEEIVSYNSRNLSDNMANQVNAKLKAQIKKSTDQAALEVKLPKLQKNLILCYFKICVVFSQRVKIINTEHFYLYIIEPMDAGSS